MKYTALLIEDSPVWVHFFKEIIANSPKNIFEFDYAEDMKTSLELMKKNDYSLVLLDLMLPDSQGEETVTAVMNQVKFTPVVVLTTLADKQMENFALINGVENYLVKDEYDENMFFHVCSIAIKRSIARIQKDMSDNLDGLLERLVKLLKTTESAIKKD
jgi:response regulator RpfG family c-di-GMP phosphodiesterase